MSQSRQLAAIMFTDIAGYTALMDEDEQKAFELLTKNRGIQKPIIEKYNGKWLKEIGDGVLASFSTVSDAVYAAGEIQKVCEDEIDLKLRIGIHVGEVRVEGEDVFGSGVNIASRLEPLAPVGGILVSGAVYKNIHNRNGINATFVEEKELRGVKEPVKIYQIKVSDLSAYKSAPSTSENISFQSEDSKPGPVKRRYLLYMVAGIALIALGYFLYSQVNSGEPAAFSESAGDGPKSIAVLPFRNDSPDQENEYFANGMLEEILDKLHKIGEINVLSRTAVEGYRDTARDPKEIADELGVENIVEGSVRMYQDRFRLTVQLIKASTGYHLWSETYDGTVSDTIFIVQASIAQEIADKLNAAITPFELGQVNKIHTATYSAYDKYINGREALKRYWAYGNRSDWQKAKSLFQESLLIDSKFSLGYSGLCEIFMSVNAIQNLDSVNYYAGKAIESDSNNGWGYAFKGYYAQSQGMIDEAINFTNTAIETDPKMPWFQERLGELYCYYKDDFITGIPHLQDAQKMYTEQRWFPSNFYDHVGDLFYYLGEYDKTKQLYAVELKYNCGIVSKTAWLVWNESGVEESFKFIDSMLVEMPECARFGDLWKFQRSIMSEDLEEARRYLDLYLDSGESFYNWSDSLNVAYLEKETGNLETAAHIINSLHTSLSRQFDQKEKLRNFWRLNLDMSVLHTLKGDNNKALEFLEESSKYGFHVGFHDVASRYPLFEPLWNDPRFKEIIKEAQEEKAALRMQINELEKQGKFELLTNIQLVRQ